MQRNRKTGSWIRRIPISRRIVLLVLLVSVVPLMAVSAIIYRQAHQAIRKTAMDYSTGTLSSVSQTLQASVTIARDFSDTLLASNSVRFLVSEYDTMDSSARFDAVKSVMSTIRSQSLMMAYANDIRIVTADNDPVLSLGYIRTSQEESERHFAKAAESDSSELWFIDTAEGRTSLILVRPIIHLGTLERYGYLIIYMSPQFLTFPSEANISGMATALSFCDPYGEVLPLYEPSVPAPSDEVFSAIYEAPNTDTATPWPGSEEDFICYITVPELNWKLVSSVPYSELLEPLEPIATVCLVSVLVCLALCVLISLSIIGSIATPLNTMVDYLSKASEMRFETELTDDSSDELGYLAQSYNRICARMKTLVAHIEQEQAGKRMAEIRMLQAQINPHFLFNTLDSLRFAAAMSSAPSVSEGLSALSHILRNSILKSNSFIPLEQEIANIRDYLVIQKIRCGDYIDLQVELEPPAAEARIMKLLLQPIVENSVIHGQEEEKEITIRIQACVEQDELHILIQDNGKGFDPSQSDMDRARRGSRMSGVGLDNVRERLALEFRERQSFSIESAPGQGTCVRITLPYTPFEPEAQHV